MSYFDFNRLINKYSCTFEVITNGEREYDDLGDYKYTQTKVTKMGAIISISENKIYRSDGVLTQKDKELFMTESLGNITNAYIVYDNCKYSIEMNPQNNNSFTNVWQYTLKWISAFDGGESFD